MINARQRFIFLHMPRTGGTSVVDALYDYDRESIVVGGGHKQLSSYERTLPDFPDYFVFTVVRNPWDRVVSIYRWKIEERLELPIEEPFWRFVLHFKKWATLNERRTYHEWLDVDREVEIIRFENLSEGFHRVCEMLGIPQLELPYTHCTSHHHYSSYYDYRTRRLIQKHFREDIERYNYVFDYQ